MRRAVALKYAREVARRLHTYNGIIGTPNCGHDAVMVRRVWVFGSTAKGAQTPNDLDLLIDAKEGGRHRGWRRGRKVDRRYERSTGIRLMPGSRDEFLKWLTRGMRRVSRHIYGEEGVQIDVKRLIYPRWEMPEE